MRTRRSPTQSQTWSAPIVREMPHEVGAKLFSRLRAAARTRGISFNVTAEHLTEVLRAQGYRCALTGIRIHLALDGEAGITASLDRINNSFGYTTGNVQWLHKDINIMKGPLDEILFYRYCRLIVAGRKGKPPMRRTTHIPVAPEIRTKPVIKLPGRRPVDPDKVASALRLIDKSGMSPTNAAKLVGIGRSTVYDAMQRRDRDAAEGKPVQT